jgi:hypothetical protein
MRNIWKRMGDIATEKNKHIVPYEIMPFDAKKKSPCLRTTSRQFC